MATPPETTTAEPARREAEFDFAGRQIKLLEPTPGQQLIMVTTLALTDEGSEVREKLEIVVNFATMLRSLMPEEADRAFVHGALARGTAELEDFIDLARQMSEYWDIGEETATNRADRRARERRPAVAVKGRR